MTVKSIRAKFEVVEFTGDTTVVLEPRYDPDIPEDQRFCEATPWGRLEMFITNPVALAELQIGREFYIDLTPVKSE